MADTVDRLITIIQMQGAAQAAADLGRVAQAANGAGEAATRMTRQIQLLPGIFGRFQATALGSAGGLTLMASAGYAALAMVRQLGAAMTEAMRNADEYNQSLTRAFVLFQNAGRNITLGGLQGLARERAFQLGIPETATLNLAGQMAERGFSPQRIAQLLPALQEIGAGSAGRTSPEQAMQMFLRVLERPMQQGGRGGMGGSRGLLGIATQLGLNIRFTGNIENDLNRLTSAIHEKFGGVAEALAATASGVHQRYQVLLTSATARLGIIMETVLAPVIERLNVSLLGVVRTMDILQNPRGGPGQLALDTLLMTIPGGINVLAALKIERNRQAALQKAGGGQSLEQQMNDHLFHIEQNTQRVASLVAQSVFGQISSFTRGAMTYRELNMAISIRSG